MDLLRYDLITQMFTILSIETSIEGGKALVVMCMCDALVLDSVFVYTACLNLLVEITIVLLYMKTMDFVKYK